MTDPIERLGAALEASPPEVAPEARAQATRAALAAFDRHHQGKRAQARHTERVPGPGTRLRRMIMQITGPRLAFIASAAGAIALVAGITSYQSWHTPGDETRTDTIASGAESKGAGTGSASAMRSAPNAARPAVQSPRALGARAGERRSADTAMALSAPAGARREADTIMSLPAAQAPAEGPWPERGPGSAPGGGDRFEAHGANPVRRTAESPVSTFSIDVDTASYAFVRAMLRQGVLPPPEAVRPEEMINYFPYEYAPPGESGVPFAVHATVLPAPWRSGAQLLHIAIKGAVAPLEEAPPANLVFLVDTSGSMAHPNKLPLLTRALKLALGTLGPDDTVGLVAYAGSAGVVLEPTRASDRAAIAGALDRLQAGGAPPDRRGSPRRTRSPKATGWRAG